MCWQDDEFATGAIVAKAVNQLRSFTFKNGGGKKRHEAEIFESFIANRNEKLWQIVSLSEILLRPQTSRNQFLFPCDVKLCWKQLEWSKLWVSNRFAGTSAGRRLVNKLHAWNGFSCSISSSHRAPLTPKNFSYFKCLPGREIVINTEQVILNWV